MSRGGIVRYQRHGFSGGTVERASERASGRRREEAGHHSLQLTDKICSSPTRARRQAGRGTRRGFNVTPITTLLAGLDEKALPSSPGLLYGGRFALLPPGYTTTLATRGFVVLTFSSLARDLSPSSDRRRDSFLAFPKCGALRGSSDR